MTFEASSRKFFSFSSSSAAPDFYRMTIKRLANHVNDISDSADHVAPAEEREGVAGGGHYVD